MPCGAFGAATRGLLPVHGGGTAAGGGNGGAHMIN